MLRPRRWFLHVTALPYDLKSNVKLFVNDKKQSVDTVSFECNSLTLKSHIIERATRNGILQIVAKYGQYRKKFNVTIKVDNSPKKATIISQDWASKQIQLLSKNDDNKKMIKCIQFLSEVNYHEKFYYLACSATLRSLMEFSIRCYKISQGVTDNKILEQLNVAGELKQIANQKLNQLSLKKEIKNLDDNYQMLNGYLHDPTSNIVVDDLLNCFNRVKAVLEYIYKSISSNQ